MNSYRSNRGISLASVIIATVLLGITSVGVVQYANSVNQHRREMDTRVQENSYRVFQSEVALSGSNPNGMANNPLAGVANANAPAPTVSLVATAGTNQAGSAGVSAYSANSDEAGRAGALGFRIQATGTAVAAPTTTPLLAPTFRLTGTVPESEFSPNLINLILGNSSNPPGTVYRYTTDGSNPTASSPIWDATSYLPPSPLPSTVRTAAFNPDPSYTTSSVVTGNLNRTLTINYGRASGGASTGFLYSEVSGGTNGITLTISNAPAGATIYYTYDGSLPTTSSTTYTGAFHVPLASWSSSVTLRAIATSGQANVTVTPLSVTVSPTIVAMPSPSFGAIGGTSTSRTVPVSSVIPGAVIRYAIDQGVTGGSPTVSSGNSVTVTAP